MTYEILYTSAPAGLKPGSSGYCTVKGSRGIPSPTLDLLESLSGYRHVFTPGTPEAAHNPVNWGHYLLRISGRLEHVLSRVSDCEPDYTGRSNKLAHHMVVDSGACPAGPAWLLSQRGWMTERWDGQVEQYATVRTPPAQHRPPGRCVAWESLGIDPGWAGVMAEAFLADPERKVFVIYKPGTNLLPLFEEALSLLPENRRWDVTFATYGPALPSTVECLWSGIVSGSPEVQQSKRFVNALRINLTLPVPPAVGGSLVEFARTGKTPVRSVPPRVTPTAIKPSAAGTALSNSISVQASVPQVISNEVVEPEPPSLPLGSPKRGRGTLKWIVVSLFLALSATSVAGLVYWKRLESRNPTPDVAKSSGQQRPADTPDAQVDDRTAVAAPTIVGNQGEHVERTKLKETDSKGEKASEDQVAESKDGTRKSMKEMDNSQPLGKDISPIGTAPVADATPSEDESSPVRFTFYLNNRAKIDVKGDSHTVKVAEEGAKRDQLSYSQLAIMIPRLPEKRAIYYDTLSQVGDLSSVQVRPRNKAIANALQFSCEVTRKPSALVMTLRAGTTLREQEIRCLAFGVLQGVDAMGLSRMFVQFGPLRSLSEPRMNIADDNLMHVPIPADHVELFKSLAPEDVVVDSLVFTVADRVLASPEVDDDFWVWSANVIADNPIKIVKVSRRASVVILDDREAKKLGRPSPEVDVTCVCEPSVHEAANRLQDEQKSLENTAQTLSRFGTVINDTPLDPRKESAVSVQMVEEFAGKLKLANQEGVRKSKAAGDEGVPKAIEQAGQEVDKYVKQLLRYRNELGALRRFRRELKLASLRLGYRVYSIKPVGAEAGGDAVPPGDLEFIATSGEFSRGAKK